MERPPTQGERYPMPIHHAISRGRVSSPRAGCAALALAVLGLSAFLVPPAAGQPTAPSRIVGTLVLLAGSAAGAAATAEIELPDQPVSIRARDGSVVATARTDLAGRFEAVGIKPGLYQACWAGGGNVTCGKLVDARGGTVWAGLLRARAERPVVFGTALTGDRRPCWVNDSFFGLDVTTGVTGGGVSTRANVDGEYALIGPATGTFRITARCERAQAGATVTLTGGSLRQDLAFANHAPRMGGLAALDSGRGVTRVLPGTKLKIVSEALDRDGDVIEYAWAALDHAGTLAGSNGATEHWQVPSSPGHYSVYAVARDDKGGYGFKRLDIQVGATELDFSGRVVDEVTLNPIRSVEVTVGGERTRTNSDGWFALRTGPLPDDRYVLTMRHANYALLARVLDRSSSGSTFAMTRVQATTGRGDADIAVTDRRSAGPCGAGTDRQQRPLRRLVGPTFASEEPEGADDPKGEGREVEAAIRELLAEQGKCERRGAQIRIPAGTLVDGAGRAWPGSVRTSLATLNPARRALPGDYQAITAAGDRAEMLSFGALYAQLTDGAGRALNLQPGTTAEVSVPVSDLQLPAAQPTIAMWSYDEASGFWREEGEAALQNTADGWRYVGKTEHFSSINMDVAGNDPAVATCARIELDGAFSAWSNLTLRAYVSYGGTSVQVKETVLDNAQYHAIYRIPYGTAFPPNTLRLELRGTSAGQQLVLLDNIINTDARPKMTGANLWPPYPYTECGAPILLTPAPGVVPPYGDVDGFGRPAFLTGPYGSFNPDDGAAQAAAYYTAIDPGSAKTTLGDW